MLVPAIAYKEELTKKFNLLRYSEKAIYFNGCIESGGLQIQDEPSEGKFQYAIIDREETLLGDYIDNVVGYLGFYVGFYDRGVWGVGLISFEEEPCDAVFGAVREMIRMINDFDLHRIEFRAIEGNPAVEKYDNIARLFANNQSYTFQKVTLNDTFKDRQGNFRDSYIYEFIKNEPVKRLKEHIVE